MASFTVIYDACVLYPAPLRDMLVRLAATGLVRARWTDDIHDEWIRNVLKDRQDLAAEQLGRTKDLMNRTVPDSLVTGYEPLIDSLELPDPNDRHVLAAAIRARAEVIVTFNRKDFPPDTLSEFDICTQHPDDFIVNLFDLAPAQVIAVARQQRAALTSPTVSPEDFLATLQQQQLTNTVSYLEDNIELI